MGKKHRVETHANKANMSDVKSPSRQAKAAATGCRFFLSGGHRKGVQGETGCVSGGCPLASTDHARSAGEQRRSRCGGLCLQYSVNLELNVQEP